MRNPVLKWLVVIVLGSVVLSPTGRAQGALTRSELSWRLQALERAWEVAKPGAREIALPQIEAAVQSFFRLDFVAAGEAMDGARAELNGGAPLGGVALRAENRIAWAGLEGLEPESIPVVHVDWSGEAAEDQRLELRWEAGEGGLEPIPVLGGTSASCVMPPDLVRDLEGTSCRVRAVLVGHAGGKVEERALEFVWLGLPRSPLGGYRSQIESGASGSEGFGPASALALVDLMDGLVTGDIPEVELPFAKWMVELERRANALESGEPWMDSSQAGDHLIAFPGRRPAARARLFVPSGLDPKRVVPLVIALHGAGGSEHMFFEAYGNGKLVELARARGWIVVSPAHARLKRPRVAGVVEALAQVLPVDRSRVAVVGHSMGALAGLGMVEREPESVAALVAMGGGRAPRNAGELAGLPVHVAVGEHDFGRGGGEVLHAALATSERSAELELHVTQGSEHLMVVQDGLERAFAFLDRALAPE